ncbi:hypothetical protein ACDF64_00430 [Agromyces sp. MMS24-JH15]|uniref:hypothetical protein n=1 Tax=Agromyces sp. MMS24-JH15 TaxID=3243765 RepID=UPI003749BE2B
MTPTRVVRPALLAVVVVLLAAGCAAGAPGVDDRPETPAATPSPSPIADPGPVPRLAGACADLVDVAALQALVGTAAAPLAEVPPASRLDPLTAAPAQAGATDCEWDNGVAAGWWEGSGADRQWVRLRILPDATAEAAEYAAMYGADPTYGEHVHGPRCILDAGYCEVQGAVGAAWVEFLVSGIRTAAADDAALLAQFRTVADPLVDRVRAASAAPAWTPSIATPVADCAALAADEAVAAITGLDGIRFGENWDGPGVGLQWTAADRTGAIGCAIAFPDRDAAFGHVFVLAGGAWGVERWRSDWLADGASVDVPGADPGAVLRCLDAAQACRLDFSAAGDWVRVEFPPMPPASATYLPDEDYAAARASAPQLAATIAAAIATTG